MSLLTILHVYIRQRFLEAGRDGTVRHPFPCLDRAFDRSEAFFGRFLCRVALEEPQLSEFGLERPHDTDVKGLYE